MEEVALTRIEPPSGEITFQEAYLVIECRLTQIMTANLDDFCDEKIRGFIDEAYEEAKVYRKYVFGEITHLWLRK